MSQQNVEIVRAAYEAWNAGDVEALREAHDPDVIARYPEDWPEAGPFVGREAVVRQIEQLRQTWDASAAEPITDFTDAGDRVIARFVWRGTGHGPAFALEGSAVYTMRNGRISLIEYFTDHAEALKAVGLSEQDAHADA
jgi:ketosteroid isomerase-like protein